MGCRQPLQTLVRDGLHRRALPVPFIGIGGAGRGKTAVAGGAPDGEVLLETTETLAVTRLDSGPPQRARVAYPATLSMRAGLHAAAWSAIAHRDQ